MSMKRFPLRLPVVFLALLVAAALGCDVEPTVKPAAAPPKPDSTKAEIKKVELGKNLFLEVQGKQRRVLVSATVCLQKGPLELLLTRKDTKEHEAILSADVDARKLRMTLELAGAKAGSPVRFEPRYQPAHGSRIKITLDYERKGGKVVSDRAQDWIRDGSTKKVLAHEWVFGGSRLVPNPLDANKPIFLANDGDLVCISNFESALLDLPIKSSKLNAELVFEANSDRIPPVGTKVTVVLEPVAEKKK